MISMKKTAVAAAMALSLGTGVAQAYPIYTFAYTGTFTMLTPTGGVWGGDPALTGSMTMDMGTGSGSAAITPSTLFSGYMWTAHNITLQAMAPGVVSASMLFDWNGNLNIPVNVDFSMTPVGSYTFSIATLDGGYSCGTDGIAGCPMASGPFPGWNATFGGTAVVTGVDNGNPVVPVPAAAWLFGSGLVGLVGVSRRKKAA